MTERAIAAAAFRVSAKAAIDRYHRAVGHVWRTHGKPSTSAHCKAELDSVWRYFKNSIRNASIELDKHPVRLSA